MVKPGRCALGVGGGRVTRVGFAGVASSDTESAAGLAPGRRPGSWPGPVAVCVCESALRCERFVVCVICDCSVPCVSWLPRWGECRIRGMHGNFGRRAARCTSVLRGPPDAHLWTDRMPHIAHTPRAAAHGPAAHAVRTCALKSPPPFARSSFRFVRRVSRVIRSEEPLTRGRAASIVYT